MNKKKLKTSRATKRGVSRSFKHVQKRIVKSLVVIGAVTVVFVFVAGAWQLRNVFEPISTHASDAISSQESSFDSDENIIFLCFINEQDEIEQLHIVSLNSQERTIREMVVPANTVSTLPLGLDEYQVKNILKVLKFNLTSDLNEFGLLQQALQNVTGTIADEVVFIHDAKPPASAVEWLSNPIHLAQTTLQPEWTQENIQTSLTRAQFIQYMWNITKTKPYSMRVHKVSDSYIKQNVQLKDGTQVIKIDPVKNDTLVRELFEKVQMAKEQVPIRIVNTTPVSGLATHIARLITNAGGDVIEITSAESNIDKTRVIIHRTGLKDSTTHRSIERALHITPSTEYKEGNFHYAITIELGNDYAQFMRGEAK